MPPLRQTNFCRNGHLARNQTPQRNPSKSFGRSITSVGFQKEEVGAVNWLLSLIWSAPSEHTETVVFPSLSNRVSMAGRCHVFGFRRHSWKSFSVAHLKFAEFFREKTGLGAKTMAKQTGLTKSKSQKQKHTN